VNYYIHETISTSFVIKFWLLFRLTNYKIRITFNSEFIYSFIIEIKIFFLNLNFKLYMAGILMYLQIHKNYLYKNIEKYSNDTEIYKNNF